MKFNETQYTIGDKVLLANNGGCYNSYKGFFEDTNCPDFIKAQWVMEGNSNCYQGKVGTIVWMGWHSNCRDIVGVIWIEDLEEVVLWCLYDSILGDEYYVMPVGSPSYTIAEMVEKGCTIKDIDDYLDSVKDAFSFEKLLSLHEYGENIIKAWKRA